jgi:hypothetical protein
MFSGSNLETGGAFTAGQLAFFGLAIQHTRQVQGKGHFSNLKRSRQQIGVREGFLFEGPLKKVNDFRLS